MISHIKNWLILLYSLSKDNKLLTAIINTLKDAEPELFHEALTDNKELLSDEAISLIDDAVYSHAEDLVLKQK